MSRAESDALVVVDDDDSVHRLVQRLMRGSRQPVISFNDAEQALDWLGAQRPAVLLLDYRMPRMSGLDLLRALPHGEPPAARTLLCTAGPAERELVAELASLPVELIDKRTLLDRQHFHARCGAVPARG